MAEALVAETTETAQRDGPGIVRRALGVLASLRLTVILFALSLFLVFVGTLAQMDAGIATVVSQYFRSLFVRIPLQLFVRLGQVFLGVPSSWVVPNSVAIPFPGGQTLGALLLVNLLAAHLVRFKLSWKRGGILLTHAGIVMLLVGELITGLYQVEAKMVIAVGETVDFADVSQQVELVFTTPEDAKHDKEIVIPQRHLRTGTRITDPSLPVDIEIIDYAKNSSLGEVRSGAPYALLGSDGRRYSIKFDVGEAAGVDAGAGDDVPSLKAKFFKKGSQEELASGVFSLWFYPNLTRLVPQFPQFPPQSLTLDGKTWLVALRPRREYKPYSLKLLNFTHEVYVGTETPKNFSSLVQLKDAQENEDREVLIYMNSPLRYRGEAFFQSSFFPGDKGTVLQVVRNPGWLLPYFACATVAVGLIWHFGLHLTSFLRRRAVA